MRLVQFLCIFFWTCASFAEGDKIEIALDSTDSRFLFDQMKGVDTSEFFKVRHHNNMVDVRRDTKKYQTQDGFLVVACNAEMFLGTMINHACLIYFDKSKLTGKNLIEEKAVGLFYGFINNRMDAIAFYERFLKPLPSFQSMEKVPVRKNDGTYVEWYRLFMTCSMENDGPFLNIARACTLSGIVQDTSHLIY